MAPPYYPNLRGQEPQVHHPKRSPRHPKSEPYKWVVPIYSPNHPTSCAPRLRWVDPSPIPRWARTNPHFQPKWRSRLTADRAWQRFQPIWELPPEHSSASTTDASGSGSSGRILNPFFSTRQRMESK